MARPRVRPLINVQCTYCQSPLTRPEDEKQYRHYCNRSCYYSWLREMRPPEEVYTKHTKEDLIKELNRLTDELGHFPTSTELQSFGKITLKVFKRVFGSWEQVKRHFGWTSRYDSLEINDVTPEDGSWLAGVIDGEGCFTLMKPSPSSCGGMGKAYAPRFTMTLRTDDGPMLEEFQRILGIDKLPTIDNRRSSIAKGMKGAKPAFKITIPDVPTLASRLIPFLEKYPVRSRKKFEFPVFKLAVTILYNKRSLGYKNFSYTEPEREVLNNIYFALRELKVFNADREQILETYGLTQFLDDPSKIEALAIGNRSFKGTYYKTTFAKKPV